MLLIELNLHYLGWLLCLRVMTLWPPSAINLILVASIRMIGVCQGCLLRTKELDVYTCSQLLRILQYLSYFLIHDEKPMFLNERTV